MTMTTDPLIVDLYAGDLNGQPELQKLVDAGRPWCGINLKATQGLFYPNDRSTNPEYHSTWLRKYWPQAKSLAGARMGDDWFRVGYHYADVAHDPVAQFQWFNTNIELAGGWSHGDLPPMLDIEDAGNPPYQQVGASKLEDWIGKWADACYAALGIRPLVYGNNYLHENSINFQKCRCLGLEVARYSSTLPASVYTGINCPISQLFGWQYVGTEGPTPIPTGYPKFTPLSSTHTEDITAITINDQNGHEAPIQWMREHSKWAC